MNAALLLLLAIAAVLGAVALWKWPRAAPAAAAQAAPAAGAGAAAARPTGWQARARLLLREARSDLQGLRLAFTRGRAARYAQTWVLLLGQAGAGKSSLVASLARVRDHEDAQGRTVPGVPMAAWHTLPEGMLIDADGRASAGVPGTPPPPEWRKLLRGLSAQRPERALDGVLLAVSARSLRDLGALQRLQLAQDARRQLQDLRAELGLVLPVYVVLTQCDALDGFGAYWRAFPTPLQGQMQGWSASGGLHQAPPGDWVDAAWDELVQRLQVLQVHGAALQPRIADADAFFLYPRRFDAMRVRMREYLAEVFQDSAWDQAFLCRGIWCTGVVQVPATPPQGVRADVAFADQLVAEKVLREHGLARITSRTIWSRDLTLRTLQQAGVAAAVILGVALGLAAVRLDGRVEQVARATQQLRQGQPVLVAGDACLPKGVVDDALQRAAAIDPRLAELTMPLSWIDSRPRNRVVRVVSGTALAHTVFPALSCGLQKQAVKLSQDLPQPVRTPLAGIDVKGSNYARIRATVLLQAAAVRDLELNFARFDRLWSVPADQPATRLAALNELSQFLYGAPIPQAALAGRGSMRAAIAHVDFPRPLPLPERLRAAFAQELRSQTARLHTALLNEVAAGPTLLHRLDAGAVPVADNATWFAAWLNWVNQSWLPSDAGRSPCGTDGGELGGLLRPLVPLYGYPQSMLQPLASFEPETCDQPALAILQAMQMAPYGPLAVPRENRLVLNPDLHAEVRGFTGLLSQTYMQVAQPQPFACVKAPGWRTVDIGRAESFAREYQQYVSSQSLAPLGTAAARRPLYLRVAAQQLELVMNDALRSAQAAAGAPDILRGLTAVSAADQQMLAQSSEFARSLQPLLATVRLYSQLGFARSGSLVAQCARDFASDALARVNALADLSRVYEPAPGPSDGTLVSLGPIPVVRDYLSRQVSRAQVLTGYADPFAALMRNTDGVNDAQRDGLQTLSYWSNTINELNRYVQFKEPAGQVAAIETLFLKTVGDLTYANCAKQLAEYRPPDYGHDLFSQRRRTLVQWLRALCRDRASTVAAEAYQRVAARFNAELAGRYPFGPLDAAHDAALGTAKAFFIDYDTQRASLETALAPLDRRQWRSQLEFIAELDKAAAFLRGSLTATPGSQPLRLALAFRARAPAGSTATGSNQVVSWAVSAGSRVVTFPGTDAPTLDWPFGEAMELTLNWADRSIWRPVASGDGSGLVVDGTSASFSGGGDWALLRMIERFRTRMPAGLGAGEASDLLLEFVVPVARANAPPPARPTSQAVLYLGMSLSAGAKVPVAWPGPFPRTAPGAPAPAAVTAARQTTR